MKYVNWDTPPSVLLAVSPSVLVIVFIQDYVFPRYLQCLFMDFHQIFVICASLDKDELIRFGDQKCLCIFSAPLYLQSSRRCTNSIIIYDLFYFKVKVTTWPNTVQDYICFGDISSLCRWIFAKFLSLVHLWTKMNWLGFRDKRSEVKDQGQIIVAEVSSTWCCHGVQVSSYWSDVDIWRIAADAKFTDVTLRWNNLIN